MLTTYYTAGKLPYEKLFPFGTLAQLTEQYRLQVHPLAAVRLAAQDRCVQLSDGTTQVFEKILLSTGAHPFVPPLPKLPAKAVYYMRTPADACRLRERLQRGDVRHAVVIGASMAGVKVAELLVNAGADCLLADLAPQMFPLAALPQVAQEIHRRVEAFGVQLQFGVGLTGVQEAGQGLSVQLGEQTQKTDLLVLCIGTRPNLELLDASEIAIDRGVVVDEQQQTSVHGIYAAGDCCAGNNLQSKQKQVLGLWANAGYQGRAAGYAMAGVPLPYAGTMPHNLTHFMGMDFIGFGNVHAQGELFSYRHPDGAYRLDAVLDNNQPVCVNILDNYAISGAIKNEMMRRFLGAEGPTAPMQRVALLRAGLPLEILERLEGAYEHQ